MFGLLVTVWGANTLFDLGIPETPLLWVTAVFAVLLAIYTAFLFAQAKGRDFPADTANAERPAHAPP